MSGRRTDPRTGVSGPVTPVDGPVTYRPPPTRENTPTYDDNRYSGEFQSFLDQFRGGGGNTAPAVTTRSVQGNETVQGQLSGLLADESEYIRRARMAGNRMAAARGSQAGSYYAGAAQGAAIDRALPIASQDAAWYGQTSADNMEAGNRAAIVGSQNNAQLSGTYAGIAGNLFGQRMRNDLEREQNALDRNFRRDESGLDREHETAEQRAQREWESGENRSDRDWRSEEAERDRSYNRDETERDFIRSITSGVLLAVLSRPEYMRDPAGASGLMRFLTEEVGSIIADMFAGRSPTNPNGGLPGPGVGVPGG